MGPFSTGAAAADGMPQAEMRRGSSPALTTPLPGIRAAKEEGP